MATSGSTGMTILPQYQGDYYSLQNKQALAQALMQGSMQNQASLIPTNMPVMPKYSIGAGLAQLGQALIAGKMQNQVAQGYQGLGQQQMASLLGSPASAPQASGDPQAAGGTQAFPVGSTPGATVQPQGGLLSRGGPLNPNGMDPGAAAMMYLSGPEGQKELFKSVNAAYAPTAATLAARQGGFDPSQANQAAFRKDISIPLGANSSLVNASTGAITTAPAAAPAGYQNMQLANGGWATVPVAGGPQAVSGSAAAQTGGEGSQLPYAPLDASGNPLPLTNRTSAATQAGATTPGQQAIVQTESNGNPNAVSTKGALGAWQVMPNTNANPGFGVQPAANSSPAEMNRVGRDYYEAMSNRYGNPTLGAVAYNMGPGATDAWLKSGASWEKLPQETRNYVGKVSTLTALNSGVPNGQGGAMYGAAPMGAAAGANAGATNQQSELSKKWSDLSAQNTQAQTTNSYLQNVADLSQKAATGQFSDRLTYANSLLSLAGSEKATDQVTANNLLSKYSNQIVARLSQGGMGTDAARSILQSAYPNAHMTPDAIKEATANLTAANSMTQAKTRLLAPFANSRDASAYNTAEIEFDQNADPRIFQYASIQDPVQRQAFAQKLVKQDPQIAAKIKNLEQMGVF